MCLRNVTMKSAFVFRSRMDPGRMSRIARLWERFVAAPSERRRSGVENANWTIPAL